MKERLQGTFQDALRKAKHCKAVEAATAILELWAEKELGDRRRKVTDGLATEIATLREDGESIAQIAERTGLSTVTVRKVIRKMA